ncbi:hypothetical protein AB0P37_14865 [Streptomyces antimycoticus]
MPESDPHQSRALVRALAEGPEFEIHVRVEANAASLVSSGTRMLPVTT